MIRVFCPDQALVENRIEILGEDFHHLKTVRRIKEGTELHVVVGERIYRTRAQVLEDRILAHILGEEEKTYESPLEVTLYQALLKGDSMDLVIQKATELGVSRIVPVRTERTIVKLDEKKYEKRRARYQKIAQEAAKQSKRQRIPEIGPLVDLADITQTPLLFAYERSREALRSAFRALDQELAILIGPEGGFSEAEAALVRELGGREVSFGPRILKGETAALVFLSILQYELGDFY